MSDIKYSYYDHFIPFYDINLKDESPENLNEIGKILAPSRDLYECKKCSTHLAFLTPQPDKAMMNICTCGDIICYECSENHNEQGHIKKPKIIIALFIINHSKTIALIAIAIFALNAKKTKRMKSIQYSNMVILNQNKEKLKNLKIK